MHPDEHANRAERLLADALRPGWTARRATVLATAALAHAELALYRSSRGSAGRRVSVAAQPASWSGQDSGAGGQPAGAALGDTLFVRLKGTDGIALVVSDFYRKVCGDIQLAHYFEHTPMPFLQRHMVAFLVQATGGPKEYRGRDMHEVHEHLRITGRDFDRVAEHLVATLREHAIAEADIDTVARMIAPLRPVIVTQGTPTYPIDHRAAPIAPRLSPSPRRR
jgi:hemoglobin